MLASGSTGQWTTLWTRRLRRVPFSGDAKRSAAGVSVAWLLVLRERGPQEGGPSQPLLATLPHRQGTPAYQPEAAPESDGGERSPVDGVEPKEEFGYGVKADAHRQNALASSCGPRRGNPAHRNPAFERPGDLGGHDRRRRRICCDDRAQVLEAVRRGQATYADHALDARVRVGPERRQGQFATSSLRLRATASSMSMQTISAPASSAFRYRSGRDAGPAPAGLRPKMILTFPARRDSRDAARGQSLFSFHHSIAQIAQEPGQQGKHTV